MAKTDQLAPIFFEIWELGIWEPAYHEDAIMEQLKAEEWGLA